MLQLLSHDTVGWGFKTDSSKAASDEQENRALFMMAIEDPHCFEQRTYSETEILYSCYDTWSCCLKFIEDTDVAFSLFLYFCFLAPSAALGDIPAQHPPVPRAQHTDPGMQTLEAAPADTSSRAGAAGWQCVFNNHSSRQQNIFVYA